MKYLILLILSALSVNAISQKKIYLDSAWNKIDSPKKAVYYRILERDKSNPNKLKELDYYMSGKIQSEADYADFDKQIKSGKFIMYYENGKIENDMDYVDGKLHGKYLAYRKDGSIEKDISYTNGEKNGKFIAYFENGKIEEDIDFTNGEMNGKYISYFENGTLREDIDYVDGKLNGRFLVYRKTGQLKRSDTYELDVLKTGKCLNLAGSDTTYFKYDIAAFYTGGKAEMMKFLANEMVYPESALKKKIKGKVYLRFIVDVDGTVKDVKVIKGVNKDLDAEAVRAVKNMPKWSPGIYDGEPVRSYFDLPVNFKF